MSSLRLRRTFGAAGLYIILTLAALAVLFPILFAASVSLQQASDMASYPPHLLPPTWHWENYKQVLTVFPAGRFLFNSLLVSALVTLGQLVTCSLAAYAFAFIEFPGRGLLFGLTLATLMVPAEVTLIPNYLLIRSLQWMDRYQGLALPFIASAFGIFLLRQFFLQVPHALYDAARIDGCGRFRFFRSIALPLAQPGLITLGAYTFLATWNQYLWPLLVTNDKLMRTVQIAARFLRNEEAQQWNLIMAGVILVLLPALVLLLIAHRQIVRGLITGAVKG